MIRALLSILTIYLVWQLDAPGGASSEIVGRIIATLAVILVFPVVYLWHFLRSPSALHQEAVLERATLQNELNALRESKPNFKIEVKEVAWGGKLAFDPNRAAVIAVLRVHNVGSRAGAIPDWAMRVGGNERQFQLPLVVANLEIHLSNGIHTYAEKDYIGCKMAAPLQPGGFVEGLHCWYI
jgi:hypothetical protein